MVTSAQLGRRRGDANFSGETMTTVGRTTPSREPMADHEQKRAALGYLNEAWTEAKLDGIDGDCLAQASLFAAFAELVTTYGEDAAATYADNLSTRIRNGEFSIERARQ
jgi:hypothetical protein